MAFILGNLEFMVALLGLRQASTLCQRGHTPLSDDVVLPVPGADLNTGNTHGIARAPAPLGAGMAQGGQDGLPCLDIFPSNPNQTQNFSGNFHFRPEKYWSTNFRSEFFWIF